MVKQTLQLRSTAERLRMLRDIFWKKAPATLQKRANSFVRYVAHLNSLGLHFPGTEADLYAFLDRERVSGAAASRIQSIMQSLLFVQHVIGFPELASLTSSRRCLGVSGCRDNGPKRPADPFRVADLSALHAVLADFSRDMAGMVLSAVYSRSCWNDIQQAEGLTLDYDECGFIAYAELKIAEHKTKHSSAFRHCYLHACAPGKGVVDDNWLAVWTQVREELGISFELGHAAMHLSTAEIKESSF